MSAADLDHPGAGRTAMPHVEIRGLGVLGSADLSAARFRLLERSGHAPLLSHPAEVLAEVTDFLARHREEAPE